MIEEIPKTLVIGPMKAGTSWIQEYLAWRGDVCLPRGVKETFFFDRYYTRRFDWYAQHFRYKHDVHSLMVEVAPSLFHCKHAPYRVAESLGEIPLVVTLREPAARSWSHYLHLRRKGYTNKSLKDAAADYPEILEASRYEERIAEWRMAVPHSRIVKLKLEDLRDDQSAYIVSLCNALGLNLLYPDRGLASPNAAGAAPSFLLAKFGKKIAEVFRYHGWYEAVNLAKQAGLKKVFFGHPSGKERALIPSPEEHAWLRDELGTVEY